MTAPFVHLRLHTEFSLVDSVVRIEPLMRRAAELGMPAVALTDASNLFGLVKFYRCALKAGIKPIIGVDVDLMPDGDRAQHPRITLLCQNLAGYRNLTRLLSRAYLERSDRALPLLDAKWLDESTCKGLIALSGAGAGDIGIALLRGRPDLAERRLARWRSLFGDRFYIELQRLGRDSDEAYINAVLPLATKLEVPVVATNDVRFLSGADFESHEARVCIHDGTLLADTGRPRRYTANQYLRSAEEMCELFADIPSAITNSLCIAERCSVAMSLGDMQLPDYPVPEEMPAADYLAQRARDGLAVHGLGADERYVSRLASELQVINAMGFAGYFLIVADFIAWARTNAVPVGPGRGSGAGSLAAYCLGITDIDPIRYDLLFERFLNPERISMPDFDIDFCMEGRDSVIDYVAGKYGRDRVSQIITYGTMAAKAVVRDCGRVLGMSYGHVDRIAKLVPFELGITLDDALEKEPELKRLYAGDDEVRGLIDLARSLEGLTRNAGTHAGGVVIAPSLLTDFAPLYREDGSTSVVTQFDKDDVEAVGLVKFDFLGLRTLTVIERALGYINQTRMRGGESPLDIRRIAMDDAATFALLRSCRTTAVFQLESRGMKDLIRRLQPDCFEDVVALVALFRPGPLQSGMVDDFINRKHGRNDGPIDYLHPSLKGILSPTYGVILYQEQVMQIAQTLAGYTLGGADLLRRAMGKKKPEEMAKQRSVFIDGAVQRGVPAAKAAHIFDLMEKFAGYGFNKSHSAAYAMLSYQTAYLKAHYPAEYMAAVLSTDMDHTDKIVTFKADCDLLGLRVLGPDVNESVFEFLVSSPGQIRYGLGAIKGVGRGAVEALLEERARNGPFRTLEELCRRLDMNRVNRRVLEALIKSGSLDSINPNRAALSDALGSALQLGEQVNSARRAGQVDLFGLPRASPMGQAANSSAAMTAEWPAAKRLAAERETLGLFLTGHPILQYDKELTWVVTGRIGDVAADRPAQGTAFGFASRQVKLAGLLSELRRRGNRVTAVLDDNTGQLEVTFFEDTLRDCRDILVKDALVLIDGGLRFDEFIDGWRLAARAITPLARIREQNARRLHLQWRGDLGASGVQALHELLARYRPGDCQVTISYLGASGGVDAVLGREWGVRPVPELFFEIETLCGSDAVRVYYSAPAGADSSAIA
ncbi:MAG: DNA polymerase III subunit alpha [Steroidobacteraceae bacterium]